jgi:hypothetical protein
MKVFENNYLFSSAALIAAHFIDFSRDMVSYKSGSFLTSDVASPHD